MIHLSDLDKLGIAAVPEYAWSNAYDGTSEHWRGIFKKQIALSYELSHEYTQPVYTLKTLPAQGLLLELRQRPVSCCAVVIMPDYKSALELCAAIIPLISLDISPEVVFCGRHESELSDHLCALELCGVESAWMMSGNAPGRLQEIAEQFERSLFLSGQNYFAACQQVQAAKKIVLACTNAGLVWDEGSIWNIKDFKKAHPEVKISGCDISRSQSGPDLFPGINWCSQEQFFSMRFDVCLYESGQGEDCESFPQVLGAGQELKWLLPAFDSGFLFDNRYGLKKDRAQRKKGYKNE